MDFYYAMTNFHLLCCIFHKLENNTTARLYISSYLTEQQPQLIERINESKIFNEVIEYKEISFTKTKDQMNDKELDIELDRVCNIVDKTIGKALKESNNIYLCSDFYSIGFYIIKNKIKYNYFEDGCGVISQPNLPYRIIEKENPNRALLAKKLSSFGNNDYVVNRYASLKDQIEGYSNPKDINFCLEDKINNISKKDADRLLKIFNVKRIKIDKNKKVNLLLTMHYNELMTREDQIKIYSHLLDYFTNPKEDIIIKPHPSDSIENYNKIFKNIKELNRKMPSELFPLCIDKKFEKGITCWSTSIFGLNKLLKNIVNFDTRIDTTFRDFDKYYAIIKYLEEIKEDKIVNLKLININEIQLLNLLKYHFKDYKKYYNITDIEDDNTIYIVDKLDDNYKNKKVLSINSSFTSNGILYIDKEYADKTVIDTISINNLYKDYAYNYNKKYSKCSISIKYIEKKDYLEYIDKIIEYKDNEIKILEEHNNEKRRLLNIKDEKIYFLYKDIDSKNETINNIYNSSSWKLTKPIRLIIDKLRHIK